MYKQLTNNNYIEAFNSGKSIWDISKEVNDTYKNISEAITGHRFEARLLPYEEKIKICNLYLDGLSTVKIGKLYGVNNKPISVVLDEFNIKRNQKRFVRKYDINEEYFDVIDTPDKAYCLGLIAADGCNYPSKYTVSMALEECDKEILELINIKMNNSHPLEYIDNSNKHDYGYVYKNQYRLLIFSKHICDSLNKYGVVPNKSNRLKFPNFLNDYLLSNYIRGLCDGDGSLGYKNVETFLNKGKRLNISITSTFDVCDNLSQYLLQNHDIYSRVFEASNHNGVTACININRIKDIDVFLSWIYKDADLYIRRKHDIYLKYLEIKQRNEAILC